MEKLQKIQRKSKENIIWENPKRTKKEFKNSVILGTLKNLERIQER